MTKNLHIALNLARKGRILMSTAILWLTLFAGVTFGQTYEVLHTFVGNDNTVGWNGNPDGANPAAALIQGPDGRFYGTTVNGSSEAAQNAEPAGTVFVMDASNAVIILHHFSPPNAAVPNPAYEGQSPYAGLILASDGYFYGTTWYPQYLHGQSGGTVFRINATGGYEIASRFEGSGGAGPFGGVIQGSDGKFYGTTTRGGSGAGGCCISGTVFMLAASLSLAPNSPLADFSHQLIAFPYSAYNSLKSGLIEDKNEPGAFYGTTLYGPDPAGGGGFGTIFKFKVTSPGGFTMLHGFDYTHGSSPIAALIQATDGNFYGTTYFGGTFGQGTCATNGCGTVFRMDPNGNVTVLHSFEYADGRNPRGVLLQGSDGNFYGTTENGGEFDYGTVFKMDAAGNVTTLHTFKPNAPIGGGHPWAGLIQATDGKLYGTTYFGGSENKGVVFRLDVGLPPRSADLAITKSASPDPVTAGSNLTYSIGVTNGGPSTATDATVTDVLPATVTFVSATPSQGSCSGTATSTCNLGTLANGGSASVTIVVKTTQAGSLSNTASVTANEIDPVSNNTAETTTQVMAANGAPAKPVIGIAPSHLNFGALTNGIGSLAVQTPSQTVRLTQSGVGSVSWTAFSDRPWISVSPSSGSGSGTLTIGVQAGPGLPMSGLSVGSVTLAFTGASSPEGRVNVSLTTILNGLGTAPIGKIDTPIDAATGLTGSIPVTGWAVDDVAVTGVQVFRDAVAGELPGALVFIGDAVFVDGARPDVQAANSDLPLNSRSGWGYLMLTNFLPHQGNGTFKLYAFATDVEGHKTLLGTRTITCDNAHATAPFGAIDTPRQGALVTGIVNNFGWILAPGTVRADVPGGGTVNVVIDGAVVGTPAGWTSRSDLTSLFPSGFSSLNSTLALFSVDTTSLTNGVHTIAWGVVANNGQSAGIGSRYFTVSNGVGASAVTANASRAQVLALQPNAPIVGRRGFDMNAPYRTYRPGSNGVVWVQAEELDRIELRIRGAANNGRVAGKLQTATGLGPLPTGSLLDADTGVFTWSPGVGFVGPYDFVLGGQNVRIVLNPKGSNRVGPQVAIDAPSPSQDVTTTFTVAGWAADLDSDVGTGVDAIHIWAYPVDGSAPVFLGAATLAGNRPDVAAIHGERFARSGYGLTVRDFARGTYDIAVFAWSTVRGGFVPAKTVRVTVR